MKSNNSNTNPETYYDKFLAELAVLSRKYGIAIKSVGGVTLARHDGDFNSIVYVGDIISGDINPVFSSDDR